MRPCRRNRSQGVRQTGFPFRAMRREISLSVSLEALSHFSDNYLSQFWSRDDCRDQSDYSENDG